MADGLYGRSLVHMLGQLNLAQVSVVPHAEEARRLCLAGAADACLLVVRNFLVDDNSVLNLELSAPGRDSGVPSLLLTEVVTPYVAQAAKRSGYLSAVPIAMTPRLLYRRISALLQKSRRTRIGHVVSRTDLRQPIYMDELYGWPEDGGIKPTLH